MGATRVQLLQLGSLKWLTRIWKLQKTYEKEFKDTVNEQHDPVITLKRIFFFFFKNRLYFNL